MAWAVMGDQTGTAPPYVAPPEVRLVVGDNTTFALDLYQQLKRQPGNLSFSPYSISTALAMTYAGARGHTAYEMAKVLHFGLPQERLHPAFGALAGHMRQIQSPNRITLLTANSLWCQRDYHFTDAFLNVVRANYQAEARQVDFIHAASAASDEINHWVEDKTMGKIKELVAPDDLGKLTRLVLCNSIYFKGTWLLQFKVSDTEFAPFHVSTNKTVTVPMMFQKSKFKMAWNENDFVEILELPYSGNELSMIILLPVEDTDMELTKLEKKLTLGNLRVWLAKIDRTAPEEVSVRLPRFTTTQSYHLKPVLKSMGMLSAFDGTADFSGIDGTTGLFVSDVLHKAFVGVDEAGTEAAAATVVPLTRGGPYPFIVDHPFIFLIRENGSSSILFIGRIVDPTR
jgi:serpin B